MNIPYETLNELNDEYFFFLCSIEYDANKTPTKIADIFPYS